MIIKPHPDCECCRRRAEASREANELAADYHAGHFTLIHTKNSLERLPEELENLLCFAPGFIRELLGTDFEFFLKECKTAIASARIADLILNGPVVNEVTDPDLGLRLADSQSFRPYIPLRKRAKCSRLAPSA